MGEAPPTPDELDVVREAIRRNPALAKGFKDLERLSAFLARVHASIGDDRFRLLYGLRPPATPIEAASVEVHAGRLTKEQLLNVVRTDATRSVDERMIRCYFEALELRVVAYGRTIVEARRQGGLIQRGVVGRWDEDLVQSHVNAAMEPLPLSGEELMTVDAFAAEARAERNFPLPRVGEREGHTIGVLFGLVLEYLGVLVRRAPDGRIRSGSLADVYQAVRSGKLPPAAALQTLLHQEYAAARSVLRARAEPRTTGPLAVGQLSVIAGRCNVSAATATVTAEVVPQPGPGDGLVEKVKVERWSHLAIGLDVKNLLAFVPTPAFGAAVRKQDGSPLNLPGKRWEVILNLASRSADGRTISRRELVTQFGLDAPPPGSRKAGPGPHAAADGLRPTGPNPSRRLSTIFSELRGHLRDQVDGPADRATTLFQAVAGN